ncbi:MAG: helix-turn-helix transcriptional regulator [Alphaproteobacteria bacterium]|jgi:DNA-binding transcriptional ArsR family regulator|nr:helix-turn-helix transcriptional regulator [Alphaproteobacteria bacterium]
MDSIDAQQAFAALSQATRLECFRLLVRHEPTGLAAGQIAQALDVPQNTMSTHLGILARAELVRADRRGRSIVYRADIEGLRDLMLFLLKDCCGGTIDIEPLIAGLRACAP